MCNYKLTLLKPIMRKLIYLLFLFVISIGYSQKTVTGVVTSNAGAPIPGVNVKVSPGNTSTTTDFDGVYSLNLKPGSYTLNFSSIDYASQSVSVVANAGEVTKKDVTLANDTKSLEEVVIVGSRAIARSNTSSSVPVDVLSAKDLTSTGQASFDKALQYRIPSFNTVQTPVNDATSLLDPYEIRNMGPSRTLILINGKRKNLSSLVYIQTSPGRGETGADIASIPTDAIERVEILRDGASAQYGSDAIAGVMNVILKKKVDYGSATMRTGVTSKGDGGMFGISFNGGSSISDSGKGFLNYTLDISNVNQANRPGTVSAVGEAADFGASLADVNAFLSKFPDARNINGAPKTSAAKFLINGGFDASEKTQVYFNAAYVNKKVNSFANYRTPYWRTLAGNPNLLALFGDGVNPSSYIGYVPTFDGLLNDYNGTLGVKNERNGWKTDVSVTVGGNAQDYFVTNSQNRSQGDYDNNPSTPDTFLYANATSPKAFIPGGTSFDHTVGNFDVSKSLSESVSIGFGAEFRSENFEVKAGDLASYTGSGADSYNGNDPRNAGRWNRSNFGGYFDLSWDVSKDFLLNGTIRQENYSDFGGAFVYKLSSRYKFAEDKITIRASYSTGFRAPTLHQIYTQKSQYSFVAGQGIQQSGIINNISTEASKLGVQKLKAENSRNFTIGLGAKITKNSSITLDYYSIEVDDRIILGNRQNTAYGNVAWFSNSLSSKTSGLDFVGNIRNVKVGTGKMEFNLAGNYTINNSSNGVGRTPLWDATQEALAFSSRPRTKVIFGVNYDIGKFGLSLNNTYFGKTTFKQDGMDTNLRTEFIPKIVSDLGVTYNFSSKFTVAANINNLFNVLPEWKFVAENAAGQTILNNAALTLEQTNLITFNGRYSMVTYDGSHFSQLGTMMNLSLNYRF